MLPKRRVKSRGQGGLWCGCFQWMCGGSTSKKRNPSRDPPKREDCPDDDTFLDQLAIWNSEAQDELFLHAKMQNFAYFLQNLQNFRKISGFLQNFAEF